jgi:drug/metabolite transporter (DMT)-like permease
VGPILYRLGRVMQLVGLLLLPLAIAGNLSPQDPMSLKTSLLISGIGIGVFFVGYLLQNAGRPS